MNELTNIKNVKLKTQDCSTLDMIKYSLGACSESLVLNSFFGFSMLYYTKALGLAPELAGIATFVSTLWDAIFDPIMGHISDNTRSRFGKRLPYILFGGIAMVASFFFIWYVPDFFKKEFITGTFSISKTSMLFIYLVIMNLVLRTAYAVFIVPYTALGFEICSDYAGRSKIQGIRNGLNMAANLLGPAMAWAIFFKNNSDDIKDTLLAQNYIHMGATFSIAAFVFLIVLIFLMAKYKEDTRADKGIANNSIPFFANMKEIILDKYPRWVFVFMFFVMLGLVLIGTLQMYVFDDFMKMDGFQKTIAHGGTMIGMGLGSLSLAFFVKRFDKKGAIYVAVIWSVFCELVLAGFFLTGFLQPDQKIGAFPIAFLIFVFFHSAYWFGNGILVPTAISMMADVSEIHKIKEGINKDASYAAMFSLAVKVSSSVAGLLAGYCLGWTGFQAGSELVQTPESIWRICALTFVVGPLASLSALCLISRYPVNKEFIENLRKTYDGEY